MTCCRSTMDSRSNTGSTLLGCMSPTQRQEHFVIIRCWKRCKFTSLMNCYCQTFVCVLWLWLVQAIVNKEMNLFFSFQPGGFTVEAVNNNSSMVMTGMRVQVGTQAIERAPSYVEVFGRTMQINLTRARWFDFPFTREEALQADKKLSIFSKSKR